MASGPARPPISDDPLINRLHRRIEFILAGAAGSFIVYTTCLPAIGTAPIAGTPPPGPSLQDAIQNVLLYGPLGLFLSLALCRQRMRWRAIIGLVAFGGMVLSGFAESVQQFIAGRVPSMLDVLCNTTGVILGALAAWIFRDVTRYQGRRIRDHLRREPLFTTFVVACCAYFVLALVPFQLEFNPSAHAHFLDGAQLTAVTPARAGALLGDARARIDRLLNIVTTGLVSTALGLMACGALRGELRFGRFMTLIVALWMTGLLACGVLAIQMFIRHADFHVFTLPTMLAGTLIGAAIWGVAAPRDDLLAWRTGLTLAASCCVVLICARELSPFVFDLSSAGIEGQLSSAGWIPLRKYFSTVRIFDASSDILARSGRFAMLGVLATWAADGGDVCRTAGARCVRRRVIVGGTALAVLLEIAQVACPDRSLDVTHVMIAAAGTGVGAHAAHYWSALLAAARRVSDPPEPPHCPVAATAAGPAC